ncbi:MAG: adenylate/guanylate cyclase domain-containing protein, partial [Nitrospirae bacterium]
VGIDILYPEPEGDEPDSDLAEVLSSHRDRVVLALGFEVEEGRGFDGEVDERIIGSSIQRIRNYSSLKPVRAWRALIPPDPIGNNTTNYGHVYSLPERDGVRRKEYLYIEYGGEAFPSLALKMASLIKGNSPVIYGGEGVEVGERFITTDSFGRMLINYYGREGSFRYVSAADVLSGRVPGEIFRDKYVLIGTSAIATYDLIVSPLSANMPGVEKNATVLSNILRGDYLSPAPGLLILFLFLVSLILAILLSTLTPKKGILLFLTTLLFFFFTSMVSFVVYRVYIDMLYPLVSFVVLGGFNLGTMLLLEERKGKEIRRIFGNYVSPEIVNRLLEKPEALKLGGERRIVTVLFSDIVGFTSLAEKASPEEVVRLLNSYFGVVTEVIIDHNGTIDKFVGDEVMAFWGAPLWQENHAELAISTAIEMKRRIMGISKDLSIDAGIGISTGEVVVGNIGVEGRKMDYTVIGDAVNLGARLEALTRSYDGAVLVSEETFKALSEEFLREIQRQVEIIKLPGVAVKGREEEVTAYALRLKLSPDA